jgi:hypothetical protein
MKRWLGFPLVQIVLCVAAYALVAYYLGKLPVVWTAPLFAYAVARPLVALASDLRRKLREHVWLPVHGKHYAYQDTRVHVIEDEAHRRWVCLADVQRAVALEAGQRPLAAIYPGCLQTMGKPVQMYIRDDALVDHLGNNNALAVLKFRTWVERSIAFPGQRLRKNLR